jgi:hypothetical protein
MSNLFRDDYFIRLPETILLRAEANNVQAIKEARQRISTCSGRVRSAVTLYPHQTWTIISE